MTVYISPAAAEKLVKGLPYGKKDDNWTIGYRTKGGSYIIANNGFQSDSEMPRDLLIILPGVWGPDGHESRVVPLTPLVNDQFVVAIRELVDEQA